MAYDSTIPSLSNLIGDDIPQMQENFQLLEDSQVVDEGSTADGDYIRYENGWQICFNSSIELDFKSSEECLGSWDYPQSFTTIGNVLASAPNLFGDAAPSKEEISYVGPSGGLSTTSQTLAATRNQGGTDFEDGDFVEVALLAIGRWK